MRKYAAATALAIALVTMLALVLSASLTPANAGGGAGAGSLNSASFCLNKRGGGLWVRAGTPCLMPMGPYHTEIIEPPHNGTAVVRADGIISYSPKRGFIGRDRMRVRRTLPLHPDFLEAGSTFAVSIHVFSSNNYWDTVR
jgi:hypothetical protein